MSIKFKIFIYSVSLCLTQGCLQYLKDSYFSPSFLFVWSIEYPGKNRSVIGSIGALRPCWSKGFYSIPFPFLPPQTNSNKYINWMKTKNTSLLQNALHSTSKQSVTYIVWIEQLLINMNYSYLKYSKNSSDKMKFES